MYHSPLKTSDLSPITLSALTSEAELEGVYLRQQRADEYVAKNIDVRRSRFESVILHQANLTKGYFNRVSHVSCDYSNTEFSHCLLRQVEFAECKLLGVSFAQSKLEEVTFRQCQINFSDFTLANLKQVTFIDCQLHESYFDQAKLPKCQLLNCDLRRADFSRSRLAGADLRGSNIEGIRVQLSQLSQAIVSVEQAVYFVQQQGLNVEF